MEGNGVKEGSGQVPNNEAKGNTEARVSWVDAGKIDGHKVAAAVGLAFNTTRVILLERAGELGEKLGATDEGGKIGLHRNAKEWLDGYGYIMGKVRRSEAGVIILAATIKNKTMQHGYRKGQPEVNPSEIAEENYVNMVTHDGLDWLKLATSYEGLVKMAREVKGKDSPRTVKVKSNLADSTYNSVQENVKKASAAQAAVIAQGALDVIQKSSESNHLMLQQIIGLCIRLARGNTNELVRKQISDMSKIASELIGTFTRLKAESQSSGMLPAAPAPALPAGEASKALFGQHVQAAEAATEVGQAADHDDSVEGDSKTGTEG